jgi:ParB family chromosome partitioning protein
MVNNATETKWFQRMLSVASAVCFPRSRIKFLDPEGGQTNSPLQGQAIVYMGERIQEFKDSFKSEGVVLYV